MKVWADDGVIWIKYIHGDKYNTVSNMTVEQARLLTTVHESYADKNDKNNNEYYQAKILRSSADKSEEVSGDN